MTDDAIPPWLGERFRRAFHDTFAPDARFDEQEETPHASPPQTHHTARTGRRPAVA